MRKRRIKCIQQTETEARAAAQGYPGTARPGCDRHAAQPLRVPGRAAAAAQRGMRLVCAWYATRDAADGMRPGGCNVFAGQARGSL